MSHTMKIRTVILAEKGITDILRARGVDPEKLPTISASDPRIASIGAKPGDIVGFEQADNSTCPYYRVVENK